MIIVCNDLVILYVYMFMYVYIVFIQNGVNTNGAAAKVRKFGRLVKKVRPGTFGNIKVG